MSETKQFIEALKAGCKIRNYETKALLAVLLMETGSSLSAWMETSYSTWKYQNFGLLQFSIEGCEIFSNDQRPEVSLAKFLEIRKCDRLKQLEYVFKYHDRWVKSGALKPVDFSDMPLFLYHLHLCPGASVDWKSKYNPTCRELVHGDNVAGRNFRNLILDAEKMLSGKMPVPNDSPVPEYFNQLGKLGRISQAAYAKKWGSTIV